MDAFDEQMQELYDYYGAANDNQLSKKLALSSNSEIAAWRKDRKIPTKYLLKISMKKNSSHQKLDDADLYFIHKTTSVKASAGGGNELEGVRSYQTGELMPIAKAFFKVPPGKNLNSMEVEGESMTPMLRSGDWVIFREDGAFAGDGLYVVNFSDQLMVKILQLTPRGMLKIVSVNPNFQSYEIDLNETQEHFKIVGKVVKSII